MKNSDKKSLVDCFSFGFLYLYYINFSITATLHKHLCTPQIVVISSAIKMSHYLRLKAPSKKRNETKQLLNPAIVHPLHSQKRMSVSFPKLEEWRT